MFQQRDKQVGLDCVWAWIAWVVTMLLIAAGTVVGLMWAEVDVGRVACLAFYVHAMLCMGIAMVLSLRIHGRQQAERILDELRLGRDVEQRVRRMR